MALRFSDRRPSIPPLDLVQRVVPPFTAAQAGGARQAFDEAAQGHLVELERALAVVGREFSDFTRHGDADASRSLTRRPAVVEAVAESRQRA